MLPFENLSGDKEQDYFADGITDDLTTDLSHLSNSFVIARNTAFTYKGKPVDVKQIGRDLGVKYVLKAACVASRTRSRSTRSSFRPRPVRMSGPIVDAERSKLGQLQVDIVAGSPIRSTWLSRGPKLCARSGSGPTTLTPSIFPCADGWSG